MNMRAVLEAKVSRINEQIADMEAHNDGSIQWVDDIRALYMDLSEAERKLAEYGGYREANERY